MIQILMQKNLSLSVQIFKGGINMNQPKYWNSIFATAVKQAYDSKKLTENNIEE